MTNQDETATASARHQNPAPLPTTPSDKAERPEGLAFDVEAHIKKWGPDIVIWGYFLGSHDPAEDAVDRSIRDYATSHSFAVASLGKVDGHEIELGYRAGCK